MTRSKSIGNEAERNLAVFLRQWWPFAEQGHPTGAKDQGDITGTPGICWEVKARIRDGYDFSGWLKELDVEMVNARASEGLVVVKPKGIGIDKPEAWWALMRLPQACHLLAVGDALVDVSRELLRVDL